VRQELNVRVLSCALADFDGKASFDPGPNPSMGRIAAVGPLKLRSAQVLPQNPRERTAA
jgi:hypothetical protein